MQPMQGVWAHQGKTVVVRWLVLTSLPSGWPLGSSGTAAVRELGVLAHPLPSPHTHSPDAFTPLIATHLHPTSPLGASPTGEARLCAQGPENQ